MIRPNSDNKNNMIRRLPALLTILSGVAFSQEQPKQEQNHKQKLIRTELRLEMALLEKQAEILRLRACSEAGIPEVECQVDWRNGLVRAPEAKPERARTTEQTPNKSPVR